VDEKRGRGVVSDKQPGELERSDVSKVAAGRPFLLAGIDRRGSCHMLRHTAATLMMDRGADPRSLQTMLGHGHLNTTELYTHLTLKRLREVHDRNHPGARDEKPPESPDN
jgi:site-specific recombinase XerD